jgi:hypothetical protein
MRPLNPGLWRQRERERERERERGREREGDKNCTWPDPADPQQRSPHFLCLFCFIFHARENIGTIFTVITLAPSRKTPYQK